MGSSASSVIACIVLTCTCIGNWEDPLVRCPSAISSIFVNAVPGWTKTCVSSPTQFNQVPVSLASSVISVQPPLCLPRGTPVPPPPTPIRLQIAPHARTGVRSVCSFGSLWHICRSIANRVIDITVLSGAWWMTGDTESGAYSAKVTVLTKWCNRRSKLDRTANSSVNTHREPKNIFQHHTHLDPL